MADLAASPTSEPVAGPSSSAATPDELSPRHPAPCVICTTQPAKYTCPRCQMRTCSLACSTSHKSMGAGCSGIRNKAAYVPMNQYGYMTLMNDYVFLEELGRKVSEWGKEIVTGGYQAGSGSAQGDGQRGRGRGRGRARGRGRGAERGGPHANGTRTKRDILKMELDFLDIEMDLLPVGMERRTLNQSTWDFSNRTALLTIELVFHPPRFLLPSASSSEPVRMLTHRNRLDQSLMANLSARLQERSQSKKKEREKPLPEWLMDLITPSSDDTTSFVPPVCVMPTKLDPLAAVSSIHSSGGLKPGHITRQAFYKLAYDRPLAEILKHKHFVEFPTIEVWEDGAFTGVIVDDKGSVLRREGDFGDDDGWRKPKRRKLGKQAGKKALGGLLGGYGSGSDEDGDEDAKEEKNVFNMLSGYAGSDDGKEEEAEEALPKQPLECQFDYELGEEDAEGETDDGEGDFEFDDEAEGEGELKDPETLAKILEELRQAGALRDPEHDRRLSTLADEDEQVDWGDSGDEE